MKIPNLSDLDREQERIYLEAPMDGVILVTGPPGSGKTVMAWHRAQALLGQSIQVQLTMYTKVLRQYVQSGKDSDSLVVEHIDRWVSQWWRKAGRGAIPRRLVEGASFRPIDWEKIQNLALIEQNPEQLKRLCWGHLIIDEGQDFSENMYRALVFIRSALETQGAKAGVTVFADDNQKIHHVDQSTTREIANQVVPGEWNKPPSDRLRLFRLRKNYRNTLQIHRFAWYFAVFEEEDGQKPERPTREGNVPEVRLVETDSEIVQLIKRICMARPAQQIGVVIPSYRSKKRVRQVYNKLSHNLKGIPYKVQAYVSQDSRSKAFDENFSDESLVFDRSNTITIVTDKSVKGLEFDIVFLLDLESLSISDDGAEETAKNLFVASSRARDELYLCCIVDGSTPPDILGFLPPSISQLCGYEPKEQYDSMIDRVKRVNVPHRKLRGH